MPGHFSMQRDWSHRWSLFRVTGRIAGRVAWSRGSTGSTGSTGPKTLFYTTRRLIKHIPEIIG